MIPRRLLLAFSLLAAALVLSLPSAPASAAGPRTATVAVVDSGVDLKHPALRGRLWRNPGERPRNGLDDDGNGYVDDVHGADLVSGDGRPDDPRGHGTMMASIIAGRGHGLKPATSRARIMALRVVRRDGGASLATVGRAIDYAVMHGADVVNISLGQGTARPAELLDAIARAEAAGVPVVVAAGNAPRNLDAAPAYPASLRGEYDNLIAVAACDRAGRLWRSSAYGDGTVDLCASGVSVRVAMRGGRYGRGTGTSHATAAVSGAIAKLLVSRPGATAVELRQALGAGVRERAALAPKVQSGGTLSLGGALRALLSP